MNPYTEQILSIREEERAERELRFKVGDTVKVAPKSSAIRQGRITHIYRQKGVLTAMVVADGSVQPVCVPVSELESAS